ncbi:hypothetical protein [Parageobacillus thermoglucosidasius]|uniref:Uncharacterized protein n=1 Tax=Parageobacillus thermoglucosidasius TaxID=1426 RepID=A0A1B7KMH8_PARTM|nr:hypothetical protein [Parageobacillus thermoglucosidasius]OAT71294.1 hypothetical protein A7K69_14480 [Parageobacillus thermoglucosidasius]
MRDYAFNEASAKCPYQRVSSGYEYGVVACEHESNMTCACIRRRCPILDQVLGVLFEEITFEQAMELMCEESETVWFSHHLKPDLKVAFEPTDTLKRLGSVYDDDGFRFRISDLRRGKWFKATQ